MSSARPFIRREVRRDRHIVVGLTCGYADEREARSVRASTPPARRRVDREIIDVVPAPIAVVSDTGSCHRGDIYQAAFDGKDPLFAPCAHSCPSPETNGVIERLVGTLKYEHLYRAPIDDGGRRWRLSASATSTTASDRGKPAAHADLSCVQRRYPALFACQDGGNVILAVIEPCMLDMRWAVP